MNLGTEPNEERENEDMDVRDDLDFDDDEDEGSLLRWVSVLFVLAAVGGFVALAWYAYKSGMQPVNESEIPYVSAEETPLKEKPEDPGGWQFEHQDKSVYNQLAAGNGAQERPVAERIMPSPEEPVERLQVNPEEFEREEVSGDTVATPIPATPAKEAAPEPEVVMEPAPVEAEETVAEVPPAKSDEETISVIESKEPESKPEPEPAPAPAVSAAPAASGQYMAQLGAFSSDEDAKAAWEKISAMHGGMFPTKDYIVQRADLGAKGVFHRLQMGPFESETAARKVCEYLQQNKQGCFVVKK